MVVNGKKQNTNTFNVDSKDPAGCDHNPPAVPGHMEDGETCLPILVDPSVSLWRCFAASTGIFDSPTLRLD